MVRKPLILVVGGAGYIGSHVNKRLHRAGFDTVVLDNLSRGSREAVCYGQWIEGDLADVPLLHQIFRTHEIAGVMHFAASLDVAESMAHPAHYYKNNVINTWNLLTVMVHYGIDVLVFSSTAAIYREPIHLPMTESHPCKPINPYGETKWIGEKMLFDFERGYGLRFCALRYFNAAGGDPEGEITYSLQHRHNLIPRLFSSLIKGTSVTLHGTDYPTPDGTCIRDYIHIDDLATAHIAALERLLSRSSSAVYNLGSGRGASVREIITAVEKVMGKTASIVEGDRRPGDPAILIASANKAGEELGWTPHHSLEETIRHAWGGCSA